MLRIFSFFSFIVTTVGQFRPPILTVAPAPTVPVFTIGSIAPIRTIGTTIQNITSSTTFPSSTTLPLSTTSSTLLNTLSQTDEPENIEEIDQNLFFIIIPSGLLLLFFIYSCLKKKKRNVNVVNIDLNIENKMPTQEPVKTTIKFIKSFL